MFLYSFLFLSCCYTSACCLLSLLLKFQSSRCPCLTTILNTRWYVLPLIINWVSNTSSRAHSIMIGSYFEKDIITNVYSSLFHLYIPTSPIPELRNVSFFMPVEIFLVVQLEWSVSIRFCWCNRIGAQVRWFNNFACDNLSSRIQFFFCDEICEIIDFNYFDRQGTWF